mmetsp:Transcript_49165/g.123588  ORF Transcript_49165/g.123588 Transcript_49165/m.123588 type:complete len:122 (-) Transcript_49165:255-620(-)
MSSKTPLFGYTCVYSGDELLVSVGQATQLAPVCTTLITSGSVDLDTPHRKYFKPSEKTTGYSLLYIVDSHVCFIAGVLPAVPQQSAFGYLDKLRQEYNSNYTTRSTVGLRALKAYIEKQMV